jgi:hypothetical protein
MSTVEAARETERKAKEAARLKDRRYLIVSNLLNGVPDWQIAQAHHIEVRDVNIIMRQAMNKVRNYLFRLCKPPIPCDTLVDARKNRINILAILPKLNLDAEPRFNRIIDEIVNANNCESALNDLRR